MSSGKESNYENCIIAKFSINPDNLNARLINSYENMKQYPRNGIKKDIKNEEQIKNCDIFINDEKIEFGYYYESQKKVNILLFINSTHY